MSSFTKTLIVNGEGGGSSLADDFRDDTPTGWTKEQYVSWTFDDVNQTVQITNAPTQYEIIHTKLNLSCVQYKYYILKFTVESASEIQGILSVGGPFSEEPITSLLGSHEYRFQCTDTNQPLFFKLQQNKSIMLSHFSLKQEGINDTYSSIKTAVDALGLDGGSVIVEEGEYIIEGIGQKTTIAFPENCSLIASGNVTIKVNTDIPLFTTFNVSRVYISNFSIKINMPTLSYTSDLVSLIGSSHCVLEQLNISVMAGIAGTGYSAIIIGEGEYLSEYYASLSNIVSQCTIRNFDCGISLDGGSSVRNNCSENMINGNVIIDCTNAIYLEYTQKNIISSNRIYNSSVSTCNCIKLVQSDLNTITENVCTVGQNRTINDGVFLEHSNNCAIIGNACFNIEKGIHIYGTQLLPANYNTITGNVYQNDSTAETYLGIYLHGYAGFNTIYANTCNVKSANSIGIKEDPNVSGAANNLFAENVIKNDAVGGISIQFGAGTNYLDTNNIKI